MGGLDAAAVAAVDSTGQAAEILDFGVHLRDALWRVESADLRPHASAGLVVAGMGGSGVGARLARAAIGDRATGPILMARDYALPPWVDERWTVLLSSYSGYTEETLACWDAATAAGARRVVVSTGGALVDRARAAKVPVIPLPGGFQPRAAVGYSTVVALEVARLAGVAPSLAPEVEAAATLVEALAAQWGPDGPEDSEAKALARALEPVVPVFCGAGLTIPVAYRWKCQVNENANRPAFWSELPELDHNEIEGWQETDPLAPFAPVFLEDPVGTHERVQRRFALTAEIVGGAHRVAARGETRLERMMSLVHLGDLVSVYVAVLAGSDPAAIPAIHRLKAELWSD
ncbi:MAG: bifunctional phosphoglucose/phosphomannose isomerase [Solirubrobacteraceae bacterium]